MHILRIYTYTHTHVHTHSHTHTRSPVVPLFVGIVEVWFNSTVPDVSLNVQSYSIFRNNNIT